MAVGSVIVSATSICLCGSVEASDQTRAHWQCKVVICYRYCQLWDPTMILPLCGKTNVQDAEPSHEKNNCSTKMHGIIETGNRSFIQIVIVYIWRTRE